MTDHDPTETRGSHRHPRTSPLKAHTQYPSSSTGRAPAWGSPASEWNEIREASTGRWTTKKTIATAALALAVTGSATATAFGLAGTGSASDQSGGAQGGAAQQGSAPGGSSGQAGGSSGSSGETEGQEGSAAGSGAQAGGVGTGQAALHTESVTQNNGAYVTNLTQTGKITAVSKESVTVESDDGYRATYTVEDSAVVSGFSAGDKVAVTGTKSGDRRTVESITDAQNAATNSTTWQAGSSAPGAGEGGTPPEGAPGQGGASQPGQGAG